MAKNQYLTSRQKGIINRYYDNQDARVVTKLQELVSDLYLTTEEKAKEKKWATVLRELSKSNADPVKLIKITGARDIKALAELIAAPGFSAERKKSPRPPTGTDDV